MTGDRRIPRLPAVLCAAVICAWTLPWAAWSVVQFDPYLAPSLFSSDMVLLRFLLYGLDWLLAPSFLVVAGMGMIRYDRGWWRAAWIATLVPGSVFGVAVLPFGGLLADELYDPAHKRWHVLAAGGGFLLLAVAMIALLLAGSPRGVLAAASAAVARAARTQGGRVAVFCGVLADVDVTFFPSAYVYKIP